PRFGFGQNSRKVHLEGEAYFSIVHTPDNKKFVISTAAGLQVEVLGTSFNLAAREAETKVVLQEGKVKVQYGEEPEEAGASFVMAPGDVLTAPKEQKKLQVKQVKYPANYSAWQHGQFMFDQTTVAEIQDLLRENYGLAVELQGSALAGRTVSGSVKAETANELLYSLSVILNISYIRQDNQVILIDKQNL
ncbi:FecR family protein, partial [Pontibacter sp. 13R65]